ncbi:MAG: UDP-N-acetylmuramoyl-L-alanine--D-glutamate ligase [Candidatus Aminicenantes bacterium]|nr:UDP-N-acetylmuramoyl-L-alanine--D-glutamate ligase [Candidatus Aminicenantes bacterium]
MNRKPVAVLGFGKTGQAVLEFLLAKEPRPSLILFNDGEISDKDRQEHFIRRGVRFLTGAGQFSELAHCRLIIMSPGFDGRNPRFDVLRRGGAEVISEIEYAFRQVKARIIAVSGSNGKSTTVSLIQHLLVASGRKSHLAGNIGVPFIAEIAAIADDSLVVLELSSFQLEETVRFRPRVAVLLNITPDHMDRYDSMLDYMTAKFKLFENQKRSDCMVLNADDPLLRDCGKMGRGKAYWFSSSRAQARGAYIKSHDLILNLGKAEEAISLRDNPLRGIHNLENSMAAALACREVGLTAAEIEAGWTGFRGLPHRMEEVGKVGLVEFINDSKATNVDAALKSINSISGNLVVILGGKDKGSDFSVLERPLRERARQVLLIGQAAPLLRVQLSGLGGLLADVGDLEEAVAKGYGLLKHGGGVVLLAPACASFDMFNNFEHRGDVFKQEVLRLQLQAGENG